MTPDIHLVLIESDLREARRIRTALAEVKSASFFVESVQRLSSGLERLEEGNVDALLVDLSLPESSGLDTFRRLLQKAPEVPIIILAEGEDETLALQAVREGAQDYLVKGRVPGEGLARCVRYAIQRQHGRHPNTGTSSQSNSRQKRILSFLGVKGGVGTSTVALNVAYTLAHKGNTVVVAELRSYAGSFTHLLRPVPPQAANFLDAQPWNSPFGFRVLFGPSVNHETEVSGEAADRLVRRLSGLAQFVVLDLPPHPSDANRAATRLSDFIGVVTEREPGSLLAAEVCLERLRGWSVPPMLGAVVVNRVPLSLPVALPDIATQLGVPVVGVVPPAADLCLLAQKNGSPLVMVQPESLVAGSLNELAARLSAFPLCLANPF